MFFRKNYGDLVLNINGYSISGVQSFDASYSLPSSNILALGGGVYQAAGQDLTASISFTKSIVGEDNLFSLISGTITGHLDYQENFFGFRNTYIDSYSAQANVGDFPSVSIDMTAFGSAGSGISVPEQESPVDWFHQTVTHGDISLSIDGQETTNRITNFSYRVSVPRRPRYNLGQKTPSFVLVDWPIEVETSFNIEIDDYGFQEISGAICNPKQKDILITLTACGETGVVTRFKAPKSKLLGEALTSSIGPNMAVTATYRAYYNAFSELL